MSTFVLSGNDLHSRLPTQRLAPSTRQYSSYVHTELRHTYAEHAVSDASRWNVPFTASSSEQVQTAPRWPDFSGDISAAHVWNNQDYVRVPSRSDQAEVPVISGSGSDDQRVPSMATTTGLHPVQSSPRHSGTSAPASVQTDDTVLDLESMITASHDSGLTTSFTSSSHSYRSYNFRQSPLRFDDIEEESFDHPSFF